MNEEISQTLSKIRDDQTIRKAVEKGLLKDSFLNDVGDSFALFGCEDTIRRLEKRKKRDRQSVEAAKRLVKIINESEYIASQRKVGRLIIKTARLLCQTDKTKANRPDRRI